MQMEFFPSRTLTVYLSRLFITRILAVLVMLVLVLMMLDLLGKSGDILAVPGNDEEGVVNADADSKHGGDGWREAAEFDGRGESHHGAEPTDQPDDGGTDGEDGGNDRPEEDVEHNEGSDKGEQSRFTRALLFLGRGHGTAEFHLHVGAPQFGHCPLNGIDELAIDRVGRIYELNAGDCHCAIRRDQAAYLGVGRSNSGDAGKARDFGDEVFDGRPVCTHSQSGVGGNDDVPVITGAFGECLGEDIDGILRFGSRYFERTDRAPGREEGNRDTDADGGHPGTNDIPAIAHGKATEPVQ